MIICRFWKEPAFLLKNVKLKQTMISALFFHLNFHKLQTISDLVKDG